MSGHLRAAFCRYELKFGFTAITSREKMRAKQTYFIRLWRSESPDCYGVGECALFRGLSAEDAEGYETRLAELCRSINRGEEYDICGSSVRFGFETALSDLDRGGERQPFGSMPSCPESGIHINGLVWMGSIDEMRRRAEEKIKSGFKCIKFKVGGCDFESELKLLGDLRRSNSDIEIRLDANGAFSPADALSRLERLAQYNIHSIEQPIKAGQPDAMAEICRRSPIPIALDEELIGAPNENSYSMLDHISPQYVILKPSLCGGFAAADRWISEAESRGIGWWATSALESDIGLNAIARWVSRHHPCMPQGLGTGALYTNNFHSPLRLKSDRLYSDADGEWIFPELTWTEPD